MEYLQIEVFVALIVSEIQHGISQNARILAKHQKWRKSEIGINARFAQSLCDTIECSAKFYTIFAKKTREGQKIIEIVERGN